MSDGGVEPETVTDGAEHLENIREFVESVTRWTGTDPEQQGECLAEIDRAASALRLVEEELRQARHHASECDLAMARGLDQRDALLNRAEKAEEELRQAREREGSLNRCIDALEDRGCAREGELMALEAAAVEHEDVKADRDRLAAAITAHRGWGQLINKPPQFHDTRLYAALSPVQGEHEQDGEA